MAYKPGATPTSTGQTIGGRIRQVTSKMRAAARRNLEIGRRKIKAMAGGALKTAKTLMRGASAGYKKGGASGAAKGAKAGLNAVRAKKSTGRGRGHGAGKVIANKKMMAKKRPTTSRSRKSRAGGKTSSAAARLGKARSQMFSSKRG